MFVLILGVMLGARLGEVFGYMLPRNPRLLWDDPLVIFRVNEGGMASHGGMVGVWLALGWFAWKHKTRFWLLMDIAVTLAPAGVFFGRLANFINGELWGRVTDVPWAVIFKVPGSSALRGAPLYLEPRHPSQLYAAGLEGLLLLAWAQWRFWRCKLPEGQLVGEMMLAYAAVRIFGEMFREPETQIGWVLGLTRGQFYSVFLVVLGIVAIVRARRAARAHSG
jgi:phosphatidylglycerol:prolipoprotein diacylglycerol transferase